MSYYVTLVDMGFLYSMINCDQYHLKCIEQMTIQEI